MSTIHDVARRAGVSIATVSRVISESPHKVNEATRSRILKAIKDLDYRPNALAQGLIRKRSMTVGIIIPDISNPYYAEIVRGVQDVAEGLGYAVVLQNTDRKKERIINGIKVLREKRADGIIFSGGIIHGYETLSSLKELAARVVVIGRHEVDFPAVRVDNLGGAAQAVQHLLDLGHERIGFFSGPKMSTSSIDRLQGYKNALAQRGRHYEGGLVKQGNLTPESGFHAAMELLREGKAGDGDPGGQRSHGLRRRPCREIPFPAGTGRPCGRRLRQHPAQLLLPTPIDDRRDPHAQRGGRGHADARGSHRGAGYRPDQALPDQAHRQGIGEAVPATKILT